MTIESVGSRCCGCRTCLEVCPTDAISVEIDQYGFEQVTINSARCVKCSRCISVCPIANVNTNTKKFSTGAAYSRNAFLRESGSSGGLFGVLSENIIQNKGVVYGAAFDPNLKLLTTRTNSLEGLKSLYKSKYLLCNTNGAYSKIKQDLDDGLPVLYCSTPCQIAALKLYLGKEYENLFLVDFACHGVGSQAMFDKSISYTERKNQSKIVEFEFRHKHRSASSHYYYYYKDNLGKERTGLYLFSPFYNAYCKQLVCRDICYDCPYAQEGRPSDITIGDFHTIEKFDSTIDRLAGVSMFAVNTEKGEAFFQNIRDDLCVRIFDWSILKRNNRFSTDGKIPKKRNGFLDSILYDSFNLTVKKFLLPWYDWKWLIYYHSPKTIRKIARRLFGELNL